MIQPHITYERSVMSASQPGSEVAALQARLQSPDEHTRAMAAQGLVRLKHPDALSACLRTLNDDPDPLHLDVTPSVVSLGEMGLKAVGPLLDLMDDPNEQARLHAQRALESILSHRQGFVAGR